MSTPDTDDLDLDDITRRLSELEAKVSVHETQITTLLSDRAWMRTSVLRLLEGVSHVRESLTVVQQRGESTEEEVRNMRRDVRGIAEKIDARPCLIPDPDPQEKCPV